MTSQFINPIVNRISWVVIFITSMLVVLLKMKGVTQSEDMEIIAFISGLISVWLAVLNSHWNWPVGIVNCVAFFILFMNARLYANAGLQILFIIISLWGWYEWLRGGKNKTELPITLLSKTEYLFNIIAFPVLSILIAVALNSQGDSALLVDTLTTAASVIAIYIMGKRKIENWVIWVSVDSVYLFLFISQNLGLTAILYAIFLTMSVNGFIAWRKERRLHIFTEAQSK